MNNRSSNQVVFPQGVPVAVEIRCCMRRPNQDFQGGCRLNSLKSFLPSVRPVVPDIDNLAKFVLDAMNGVVYHDDRQVCQLRVAKVLDDDGDCGGKTIIHVKEWNGGLRGFGIMVPW